MRKFFKLHIIAVLFPIIVFMVVLLGGVGITYAANAGSSLSEDDKYAPYRVQVKSDTKSHTGTSGSLSYTATDISDYDYFEYVLELVPEYVNVDFMVQDVYTREFQLSGNDIEISLHERSTAVEGTTVYFYISDYSNLLPDPAADYNVFSLTATGVSVKDVFYLTLTNERAFVSLYSEYDNTTESEDMYDISLKHIVFELAAGSSEYQYLYSCMLPDSQSACSEFGKNAACADYYVTEHLRCYNTVLAPVKEGYTFTGWYYDEACTVSYGGEEIEDDVQLYAGFEINKYTVKFDTGKLSEYNPNDYGFYDKEVTVEYGAIAEYIPPEIEGVVFLGWYYEDDTQYENTPVAQDMTLYGKWDFAEHTVTLKYGYGVADETITVKHGQTIYPENKILLEGAYEVYGWYCAEGEYAGTVFDTTTPITSDIVLTARVRRHTFTVTFYVDDKIYDSVQVERGAKLFYVIRNTVVNTEYETAVYYNLNEDTPDKPITEYTIEDDVAVHLKNNTSGNESGNTGTTSRVKQFFEEHWIQIAVAAFAVLVVSVAIVCIAKRRR